jgi:uncharacterized spore protein YtfJ
LSLRLVDWWRREETTMDDNELMQQTRDTLTVSRLFGEAYERNGTVVVPVAAVRGGGGGGHGEGGGPDGSGSGSGSGGGFGLAGKPAGVYVIDGPNVVGVRRWTSTALSWAVRSSPS